MSNANLTTMASEYLSTNDLSSGVVLFWSGCICGWQNELRDPQASRPGVIAVDADGKHWHAVGGNDYDGADSWQPATTH